MLPMFSGSIRIATAFAAALTLSLACASVAGATVGPAGNGEPPTTKGTTNTWHFAYTPVSTGYNVCFSVYKNNGSTPIKTWPAYPTGGHPGTGNGMCTGAFYSNQSGTVPYTETNLEAGASYSVCATSFENYGDGTWFPRQIALGSCSTTTIDFGKPTLTTWVAGEAQYTKDPIIPIHMQYSDALSHPWSQNRAQSNAKAATIGCLTRETSCTPNAYADGCSTPNTGRFTATPGFKQNSFNCAYDFGPYEDGRVTFCATQSDWALADKPGTTDQFSGQTSSSANTSDVACGNVILDRGAPTLDAGADRTVKAGDLVNFSASANDALSGVGQIAWTFGDNTQGANGPTATHTYTQPGTYVAKASTTDGAGNAGEDTVTITVQPAGTTPGGGGGTTPGGGSGGTGGTGGTTKPGTQLPSTGGTKTETITQTETRTILKESGATGGTATVAIAGLDVEAPKALKVKKAGQKLPVLLDAEGPGVVALALAKGAKVVARGGTTLTAAGTFVSRLKLPAALKSGTYTLRVSFTPQGQTKATTKKLTVKITVVKKKKARASSVPRVGRPVKP
jgi:hypothetical protein